MTTEELLGEVEAAMTCLDELRAQVYGLARFIMDEIPGEPSQGDGAVATAIRIMRRQKAALAERDELKAKQDTLETNFSHLNKRYWEMVTRVKKSEDTLAEFVRRARECGIVVAFPGPNEVAIISSEKQAKAFSLIRDLAAEGGRK